MAHNGQNTDLQVKNLNTYIEANYQTDIILLAYCLNDIDYLIPAANKIYNKIRSFNHNLNYFEKNSYFLNTLTFRAYAKITAECRNYGQFVLKGYQGRSWEIQKQMLKKIHALSKDLNSQLIIVTFPFLQNKFSDYQFKAVHQKINDFWKKEGVPHLDLLYIYKPHLGNNLTVNKYDAHPNEFAHKLAAKAILDSLLQRRLN